ncbi:MAG: hypothetical protein ABR562_08970, partial [Thermoplasmatota archaeon]
MHGEDLCRAGRREGGLPRWYNPPALVDFAILGPVEARADGEPIALGGAVVSSTRIRQALREGDLDTAQALLGRPYSVAGTIVRGEQRGRGEGTDLVHLLTLLDAHEVERGHAVHD